MEYLHAGLTSFFPGGSAGRSDSCFFDQQLVQEELAPFLQSSEPVHSQLVVQVAEEGKLNHKPSASAAYEPGARAVKQPIRKYNSHTVILPAA